MLRLAVAVVFAAAPVFATAPVPMAPNICARLLQIPQYRFDPARLAPGVRFTTISWEDPWLRRLRDRHVRRPVRALWVERRPDHQQAMLPLLESVDADLGQRDSSNGRGTTLGFGITAIGFTANLAAWSLGLFSYDTHEVVATTLGSFAGLLGWNRLFAMTESEQWRLQISELRRNLFGNDPKDDVPEQDKTARFQHWSARVELPQGTRGLSAFGTFPNGRNGAPPNGGTAYMDLLVERYDAFQATVMVLASVKPRY